MVKYPGEGSGFSVGIVVGGDSEDPAKDQAGGVRVRKATHGENVPHTDLPFSRKLGVGSQDAMHSSSPPLERGTAVICIEPEGRSTTGDVIILGALTNEVAKGGTTPGNSDLAKHFEDAINHVTNKKSAPKSLKKDDRDGAEIRTVEDAKMWSHSMAKGLPSALGLWPMAGIHLDQVKGISTAIQSFASIPMPSMLGQLPGLSMSLGGMLSQLGASGALDRIKAAMPTEALQAFDSMSNLITTVETATGSAYGGSARVNPLVFLQNAEEMLSKCRDISDMVHCFNELQSNTDLHGLDSLPPITIEADTPFGAIDIEIDYNGSAKETIDTKLIIELTNKVENGNTANGEVANAANQLAQITSSQSKPSAQEAVQSIMKLAGMLQSASQAFSMSGEAFFGKSAGRHLDMMKRLNGAAGKTTKALMEKLHTGEAEVKHLKEVAKFVRDGGKVLSGKGFK